MAYVAYEDLTPARVNYRVVPKLRKYYRADGTFDLFDINKRQMCCFRFLASKNEFGLTLGRGNYNTSFGTISTSSAYASFSNKCTLTTMNFTLQSILSYGAIAGHDLKLKLNNSAGYYPYYVATKNASDHNVGNGYIYLYNNSTGTETVIAGGSGNRTLSHNTTFNTPSTLWDYKDYNYVRLHGYAVDTSKFIYALVSFQVYGIHKFNDEHPLYRYYR